MADEGTFAVAAAILNELALGKSITTQPAGFTPPNTSPDLSSPDFLQIDFPGEPSLGKEILAKGLVACAARVRFLESQLGKTSAYTAALSQNGRGENSPLTVSPSRRLMTARPQLPRRVSRERETELLQSLMDGNLSGKQSIVVSLSNDDLAFLGDHVKEQEAQIHTLQEQQKQLHHDLDAKTNETRAVLAQAGMSHDETINYLVRELKKRQQTNDEFSRTLKELGGIITAVAGGDLSQKLQMHSVELDPEITTLKRNINTMTDQLQVFAREVSRVAREVGTEGQLGGQAHITGVAGVWKELTGNVNVMAKNLTDQVREIAAVTGALAHGDLSRKIHIQAQGEVAQLQGTINGMVDQLRQFATEVTRVARDVGTAGVLGGQASTGNVEGMWNDLTISVNAMANNLTTQVRDIAKVTTALAKGDLTQKVTAECDGEILSLKTTINGMVDRLQQFAEEVTKIAREVGTDGILGGQAKVDDVDGIWKDLTESVNAMANNLTTQVREISSVTKAVADGDLSKHIAVEVRGEVADLKNTINTMVDRLRTFAAEVSKVAREVGTDGTLGGQAEVDNVSGKWRELTENVNVMAQNLTGQVRAISDVTQALASGDMSRKLDVHAAGEILLLKETINNMVDQLAIFASEIKRVARDVGVDGKLGGQAKVEGIQGGWKEITADVNTMASNLTTQVRAFADISSAATAGEFNQLIVVEAQGEMNDLKLRINQMIISLGESFRKNQAAKEDAEKAKEDAENANQSKSEFLANMSHELRTPLSGMLGMIQLTLETELTSLQRDQLHIAADQGNGLLTIIDDILDISKIEAGHMNLEKIAFSLRTAVFTAMRSLSVKATAKGIDLILEVDTECPDWLIGDPYRLRQVVINLAGNAIKFTAQGYVKLSLKPNPSFNPKQHPDVFSVLFMVSDTGIGVEADKCKLIFENFQQADGSTTRKFGGTGLGLSISKSLVALMEGHLWVESQVGFGSQFYFTCVFAKAASNISLIMEKMKPYAGRKVLIADHDMENHGVNITESLTRISLKPHIFRLSSYNLDTPLPLPDHPSSYDALVTSSTGMAHNLRSVTELMSVPLVLITPALSLNLKMALDLGITACMKSPPSLVETWQAMSPALESRATPDKAGGKQVFNILLAEDNIVNQHVAVRILRKYRHHVTVANNGKEAFDMVRSGTAFDVILMDVQMPIMGGLESTRKIRLWERENEKPRNKIIALTAHAMLGDREKCITAGMDEYLSKPLKAEVLNQMILRSVTLGLNIDTRASSTTILSLPPAPPRLRDSGRSMTSQALMVTPSSSRGKRASATLSSPAENGVETQFNKRADQDDEPAAGSANVGPHRSASDSRVLQL
ncbi:MAG: histidine kinase osmosensor [Vezdaea aestivalis]|nr:MAG: histidine kinase osmosensor [Vezdaea aestivalis]